MTEIRPLEHIHREEIANERRRRNEQIGRLTRENQNLRAGLEMIRNAITKPRTGAEIEAYISLAIDALLREAAED